MPTQKSDKPVPATAHLRGPEFARDLDMLLVAYAAFVLGLVSGGLGALVGVIIAYVKRPEVAGTWRESHYTWLIYTFWLGLVFVIVGAITTVILIGFLVLVATFIWFVIRLLNGWMAYSREEPVADPENWMFG